MGLLPCSQVSAAKKKLGRLGLPDEVVPAAERFLEDFISKRDGKETVDGVLR